MLKVHVPLACPPWTGVGKKLESLCRKALYEFGLLEGVDHIAVALSGGKDSLTLLYLLAALSGRGFPPFKITAIHVEGAFSCGPSIGENFLKGICEKLQLDYVVCSAELKQEDLECYSCSRTRRSLLFQAAKERGIQTIAFGHHRDDSIQTLLMNLLHKAEFAALLPKVPMLDYGITIIRPLIFAEEQEIISFAQMYGFSRISCQCPVGAVSLRQKTKQLISQLETLYPNARQNLSQASFQYGSQKALNK